MPLPCHSTSAPTWRRNSSRASTAAARTRQRSKPPGPPRSSSGPSASWMEALPVPRGRTFFREPSRDCAGREPRRSLRSRGWGSAGTLAVRDSARGPRCRLPRRDRRDHSPGAGSALQRRRGPTTAPRPTRTSARDEAVPVSRHLPRRRRGTADPGRGPRPPSAGILGGSGWMKPAGTSPRHGTRSRPRSRRVAILHRSPISSRRTRSRSRVCRARYVVASTFRPSSSLRSCSSPIGSSSDEPGGNSTRRSRSLATADDADADAEVTWRI